MNTVINTLLALLLVAFLYLYLMSLERPSQAKSTQQTTDAIQRGIIATNVIQFGLKTLGYYDGEVDGIPGKKTVLAIEHFQSKNGLPPTGRPDGETMLLLIHQARAAME